MRHVSLIELNAKAHETLSASHILSPDTEIDFESYQFNIPAVRELANIDCHPNVTFFVGENGFVKSKVLDGLAEALGLGVEGGTKNVQFRTADSISPLHDSLRLARGVPIPRDGYFLRQGASSMSRPTWTKRAT